MSHNGVMELTVKEYAHAERVTERTVRTWIAKGAVSVRRTPSGRVRIRSPFIVFDMKNTEDQGRSDA